MNRIPDEAFGFYVGMGPERSYRAVSEKYGVSKRANTKRAVAHDWSKRLEKIEEEARQESDRKLAESLEETRSRHLKMLRVMGGRAISALKQYPLSNGMDAVRAAEAVIKLERLVIGESTDRSAIAIEEVTRQEMQSLLKVVPADEDAEDDGEAP